MRFKGGLAIFVAAIALTPATASAAVRYTSPGGSGLACSQASPCSLLDALGVANSGDEIRLQAAEYDIAGSLPSITQLNLTISGPPGRYTPSEDIAFLRFTSTGDATRIQALNRNLTLRRLGVTGSSGNQFLIKASDSSGLTLDRVLVLDSGSFGSVYAQDATILNSVISQSNFLCTPAPTPCRATEVTGTISDSTIISAAELGTAISNDTNYHNSTFGDRCDLTVQNTLAVGRVYNLRTNRGSGACTPTVVYNYSWIPTSGTGGGISDPGGYAIPGLSNLPSAPAALTDPLGGNFTPAFGSPAINAGLDASSEDLYGRPRPIGIAHDIGAVEAILPPTLSTVSVGTVTSSSAPVSATVNPNGGATTYNFQLRKAGTSEWGSFDGATTGDGATAQSASGTANPLDASTDYEVRIVGANSAGEVASSPVAFRTPAAPAPPGPTLSLTVSSLKAKVGKKGLYFTSRATVNAAGSLSQTATTGSGKKTKTWCRTMTTARAAATYSLKCNLGSKGRKYLKKRSLTLTVKTTLRAATGTSVTDTRKLKIKRRR